VELILNDGVPISQVEKGLRAYLKTTEGRYKGAVVTLNLGKRMVDGGQVERLRKVAEEEFGLSVAGVSCDPRTLEGLLSGKADALHELLAQAEAEVPQDDSPWQETLLFKGTCRSGVVVHNDGNVVVLGDVNPGAEVTATKDVIVFGRLRGMAHAGLGGSEGAVVVALSMEAPQVRVGPYIYLEQEAINRQPDSIPRVVLVRDGMVVVEPFTPKTLRRQEED
jgi:septum site-determining protein MinC